MYSPRLVGINYGICLFDPKDSPLGCLLTHWSPFGQEDVKKKCLFFRNDAWPQSSLRDDKKKNGPLTGLEGSTVFIHWTLLWVAGKMD